MVLIGHWLCVAFYLHSIPHKSFSSEGDLLILDHEHHFLAALAALAIKDNVTAMVLGKIPVGFS